MRVPSAGVLLPVVALALLVGLAAGLRPTGRAPTSYYLSPTGSDRAAGTSPGHAWRTFTRLEATRLGPGDRVLLAGGSTFAGYELVVRDAGTSQHPIQVTSYGGGVAVLTGSPVSCVRASGSWIRVHHLTTRGCTFAGVSVTGSHVTVDHVDTSGNVAGVAVEQGSDHTVVRRNRIHDNRTMNQGTPGPDDDSGAFGVLVNGDHALVTRNTITGHFASSADYGEDGSAVEIFGAQHTTVSYNIARQNQAFTEIAGVPGTDETRDAVFAYNQVTSDLARSAFLILHVGGTWGNARGTRLLHNTAVLTGADDFGLFCGPRCSPAALAMQGNLVRATVQTAFIEGGYAHRDDVWAVGFPKCVTAGVTGQCPGTYVDDPGVDTTGRFVVLTRHSPARDAARPVASYDVDIAGAPVRSGTTDVGAWQHPSD